MGRTRSVLTKRVCHASQQTGISTHHHRYHHDRSCWHWLHSDWKNCISYIFHTHSCKSKFNTERSGLQAAKTGFSVGSPSHPALSAMPLNLHMTLHSVTYFLHVIFRQYINYGQSWWTGDMFSIFFGNYVIVNCLSPTFVVFWVFTRTGCQQLSCRPMSL